MGILRIYLALCVIAAHTPSVFPWAMHSGREAVQIFFIISGFYMQLIANKYGSILEFYASRFIRIFIPYWTILFAILLSSAGAAIVLGQFIELSPYKDAFENNGVAGVVISSITNLILFGQDMVMFLSNDVNQSLSFTTNFQDSKTPLYYYLLIPQAWSVGVELTFYLLVPMFSKLRTKTVLVLILASLAARIYCYEVIGLTNDPWTYRFFPFELFCFLLGMIACRVYQQIPKNRDKVRSKNKVPIAYFFQILGLLTAFFFATAGTKLIGQKIGYEYAILASYLIWATTVPFLFHLTQRNGIDRYIGELSYPVYLTHYFIVVLYELVSKKFSLELNNALIGPIVAIITIAISLLLLNYLITPLDSMRYKWAALLAKKRVPS